MLLEFISLASGLNFTVLAIILYRKNTQNLKATNILIRLLLFMAVYSSVVYLHYKAVENGTDTLLSYYLPIDGILLATLAPCLYLYVMATLQVPVHRNRLTVFLHSLAFIPFIAFNLYFVTLNRTERMDWLIRDFHSGTIENNLLNAVLYVQIIVYLFVSYAQVRKKTDQTCGDIAVLDTPNLKWLKYYLLVNISYAIVSIPFCIYFANEQANIIIGQLAMDIQFVYLFFRITSNDNTSLMLNNNEPQTNLKKRKLNHDDADIQLEMLNTYMKSYRPYLNEACNIQTLSEQTGIPQYQLTNLLNCKVQKTFPEYINEFRIQAAQRLLLTMKTDISTIESIAVECGFGSKSNFNRTFKKYSNNLTPTEFIRQHKAKE